jgi:hypothetical protein
MSGRLYRFVALAVIAFWIGGTTFYALVVVPTGTRVLGGTEQGFLTEQVTRQLNWIGVACLAVLAPNVRTSKLSIASWSALAVTLAILFWLHPRVATYLDHTDRYVTNDTAFYQWHRAYLLVTALQWLAGLGQLWSLSSVAHYHSRTSPTETLNGP